MTWLPKLSLDPSATSPLFLQIARAVSEDIERGRLTAGERLPGSRSLAASLMVHRNTVTQAYAELEAQGWVVARPARGVFVATAVPRALVFRSAQPLSRDTPGFQLPPLKRSWVPPGPKAGLVLYGGIPDLSLTPTKELARAYRSALLAAHGQILNYAAPEGHPRLRQALSEMLRATRGIAASKEQVFVTRGSQMALYLVARAALPRGGTIAVERWGYPPAWQAFRAAGARLVPVPVDRYGLCTDALARLLTKRRIAAVYLTPHHQYPTTVMLPPARRMELLSLAQERGFAIIEDDYDHEFHYAGRPVLPLASADRAGVVLYVGTLSKILAPGLRAGYLVAPTPVLARVSELRAHIDRQGDPALEVALATLLEEGEVERHARRAQRRYHERRDALASALSQTFGSQLRFDLPPGGMALWVKASGIDVDAWADRCGVKGVHFVAARRYAYDKRSRPYVRLGYAALPPASLYHAVKLMAAAL